MGYNSIYNNTDYGDGWWFSIVEKTTPGDRKETFLMKKYILAAEANGKRQYKIQM